MSHEDAVVGALDTRDNGLHERLAQAQRVRPPASRPVRLVVSWALLLAHRTAAQVPCAKANVDHEAWLLGQLFHLPTH